jgi:hypothetical protein
LNLIVEKQSRIKFTTASGLNLVLQQQSRIENNSSSRIKSTTSAGSITAGLNLIAAAGSII